MFVVKPGNVEIFTNESLTPSENPKLGQAAGSSYCDTPFTISYEDAPPQPVPAACGQWTIKRTWKIQPEYADCGGSTAKYAADLTATHVQEITIIDKSAPEFAVLPADQIDIPFYDNYRKQEPLPYAEEVAHDDMKALGLVSYPIQLISTDEDFSNGETSCFDGLASFTRVWKVMDACGNSAERYQTIVVQHPPAEVVPLQVWSPGEPLSLYAPGVLQLSEKCHPGKRIALGTRVYDRLLPPDSSCSDASSPETGCWTESSSKSSSFEEKEVYPIAPTFNEPFPSDVKRYTNDTLDPYSDSSLGVASGSAPCGTPFEVAYSDGRPVEVPDKCGVWTIERSWKIQPRYDDCGSADASLTQTRVQVITVVDSFAPQFTETPAPDQFVEFLTDYGTSVTGVPVVEDVATHPDMSLRGLVSYPITLEFADVNVVFHANEAGLTEGVAVVSRQWTAQDRCGNTATWMQTVRVRSPQGVTSGGGPWNLGPVSPFTLSSSGKVSLKDSTVTGTVYSDTEVDSDPTSVTTVPPPPNTGSLLHEAEATARRLASFDSSLFSPGSSPATGPRSLLCRNLPPYPCDVVSTIAPPKASVTYSVYTPFASNDDDDNDDDDDHRPFFASNMTLKGDGQVYNFFSVDLNAWRVEDSGPSSTAMHQIVQAQGFVIINVEPSALEDHRRALRKFVCPSPCTGEKYVLYNVQYRGDEYLRFEQTQVVGSLLVTGDSHGVKFKESVIRGQVWAAADKVEAEDSQFDGVLFAAN